MRLILAAALVLAAVPAGAQDNKPAAIREPGPPQRVAPDTPPGTVVVFGETTNSGPGASSIIAPTGTGAATITTDSAVGGNAEQTTRGLPQTGGGGGNSGGGS